MAKKTKPQAQIVIPKLGKAAPRLDPRTFQLAKFLHKDLPPAPAQAYYQQKVGSWPLFLNDEIGDCTCAAAGHAINQWTVYAGKKYIPSNAEILKAYEDVSGYDPADMSTDQGAVMLDVLNYWRKTGVGKHKITAFVQVDPKNREEVKQAINLFGNLYTGLQLPLSVLFGQIDLDNPSPKQVPWHIDDSTPDNSAVGSWGGHAVSAVGYDANQLTFVTWGRLQNMSWNFFGRYCDEAYALLSEDWIATNGVSASGFNIQQLKQDLAAL